MWRMHVTSPVAAYIMLCCLYYTMLFILYYFIHIYILLYIYIILCLPNEWGLDCLSSLPPRLHTGFIASWASCWPKDTSPWLLKCLSSMSNTYSCQQGIWASFVTGLKTVQHWWFLIRLSWSLWMMTQEWTMCLHDMLEFCSLSCEASVYIFGQFLTVSSLLLILENCIKDRILNNPKCLCQWWM